MRITLTEVTIKYRFDTKMKRVNEKSRNIFRDHCRNSNIIAQFNYKIYDHTF